MRDNKQGTHDRCLLPNKPAVKPVSATEITSDLISCPL